MAVTTTFRSKIMQILLLPLLLLPLMIETQMMMF